ncbi:helix-turn-helix transcriptional regulator [Pinisolibacter aquiterrae]|uniref:helix-turn-helix transcriptional regulator n=1 Tax=Pinisolibacter aquiterrae TaxID=2815579 RepID=UPI001C3C7612|nr:helix-turn-helix transcriptional regulator [Pinisolibacter aquiterrae]MBV5263510.1 helix-turn-helix transcriptional regulator [Pinisolibacter aquiterrae]MCC8237436.1 helix-turn-helix transcriptional regulator [Pinisolibacter aquiterrae]
MDVGETIHDAVRSIYDAATRPDLWPDALQAIAACSGDVGTVLIWRRDDGSLGTIVSPALEASHAEYVARWASSDTRAFRVLERGFDLTTDAVTDRDVVEDDEVATLPIYTDYLVPQGLGWFAAVNVAPNPRVTVFISVQRRFDKPRFGDDELRLVAHLGRHVEQSLRLGIRLFDAEMRADGLARVLSSMNIGVFGLDSLGRVTMSNPAGGALRGALLDIREGRLAPTTRAERAAFAAEFARCLDASSSTPKPVLLGADGGGDRVVLHVLPLTTPDMLADAMLADTRVLVLAVPLDRGAPVDPTVLRDLLGLTLNEARIASLVGTGLQPRAVAERLGIAEDTARTVLKRVFAKIGVSRQAELVGLLARLSIKS